MARGRAPPPPRPSGAVAHLARQVRGQVRAHLVASQAGARLAVALLVPVRLGVVIAPGIRLRLLPARVVARLVLLSPVLVVLAVVVLGAPVRYLLGARGRGVGRAEAGLRRARRASGGRQEGVEIPH